MDNRWNHIIACLALVYMIVWMNWVVAVFFPGYDFICPCGNDFIHIHVCGGAGSGLEDIYYKLVVKFAIHNFLNSCHNSI